MPQPICCPRCLSTGLFSPEKDTAYVDLYNVRVKLYRCKQCALIFFIKVPQSSDGWRLLSDTRISTCMKEGG
jgi:hypothetical protein